MERRPQLLLLLRAEGPARFRDRGREHDERRDLGDERLRGGHGDLRAGLQEEDPIRFPGDRRTDGVGHGDHRRPALPRQPGRRDRVGRLARLGDGDHEGAPVDRRGAVAELGADRRPRRDPEPVLDRGRADEGRVIGRPARDQLDPVDLPERLVEALELLEPDPVTAGDPPGDRLAERIGLLVDLLEHEVLVAALLGGLGRPLDQRLGSPAGHAIQARDLDAGRPDVGHVTLLEEDDPVRVGEDRGDVAGNEALLAVPADDQWHVLAGTHEAAHLPAVHDDERVGALDRAERRADGVGEVARIGLLDEVRQRLRVGLRGERVAPGLEPVAELPEVLDDPVVNDRDVARAVLVRVRVQVVRASVGRPAGVGQADRRVRGAVGDRGREVRQLAGLLLDEQVAVLVDEGDPGRVVPAVLESLQALHEDGTRLAGAGIADDAAHAGVVLRCGWSV